MLSSTRAREAWLAVGVHLAARAASLVVMFVAGGILNESAYRQFVRWDAHWYRRIAESGYGHSQVVADGRTLVDYAFFPLYPGLERVMADATGLRILDAGLAISAASAIVAAVGILFVGRTVADGPTGVLLVALWSTLPIANVQSMAYAESLFTALAAWSLFFVLTERFAFAGALALLAGLTRPLGAALAVAVWVGAIGYLRRHPSARPMQHWSDGPLIGPIVGLVLAPLGCLAFLFYVALKKHSLVGYFQVAKQWHNNLDGGVAFFSWLLSLILSNAFILGVLLVAGVSLLILQVWFLVRDRYPLPLIVFVALSIVVTLSTSGYFGSKPRYLLPVFPLLLPLATRVKRMKRATRITVVVLSGVISATYGAVWLFGPGPP